MNYLNAIAARAGLGATPHPAADIRGKKGRRTTMFTAL